MSTVETKIGVFTVTYSVLEIRRIEVTARSQEEAEELIQTQKGLYSEVNPLFATDRWVQSQFFQVIPTGGNDD